MRAAAGRQVYGGVLCRQSRSLQARRLQARPRHHPGAETDEEIFDNDALGIQWLLKNKRDLIDAEFALNEGGSVGLKDGKPIRNSVQTSEKVPVSYELTVRNKGGHSSVPAKDNAIYRLAAGLTRLFGVQLSGQPQRDHPRLSSSAPRRWKAAKLADDLRAVLKGESDPTSLPAVRLSANPFYNAQLRTTCVATMLDAGSAINALPQVSQRQGQLPRDARRDRSTGSRQRWNACWPTTRSP